MKCGDAVHLIFLCFYCIRLTSCVTSCMIIAINCMTEREGDGPSIATPPLLFVERMQTVQRDLNMKGRKIYSVNKHLCSHFSVLYDMFGPCSFSSCLFGQFSLSFNLQQAEIKPRPNYQTSAPDEVLRGNSPFEGIWVFRSFQVNRTRMFPGVLVLFSCPGSTPRLENMLQSQGTK